MADELTDRTGARVTVDIEAGETISAYTIAVEDGRVVGRAEFADSEDVSDERIFFHTEVDPDFGGRGLAGVLVGEALTDSIRRRRTVVPVCPLFARRLEERGEEFVADGGTFRKPRKDDVAFVSRLVRDRS